MRCASQSLDQRTSVFPKLLSLSGRLDLALSQVSSLRQGQEDEGEPRTVYDEEVEEELARDGEEEESEEESEEEESDGEEEDDDVDMDGEEDDEAEIGDGASEDEEEDGESDDEEESDEDEEGDDDDDDEGIDLEAITKKVKGKASARKRK